MEIPNGSVVQGTCGWSDESILRCGRFYPSWVRSSEDRLRHLSRHFGCVECDSSNYAIPRPEKVAAWCSCVPNGFQFHFKAFGLFTRKTCPAPQLPKSVRDKVPLNFSNHQQVSWSSLGPGLQDHIWQLYNSALEPAKRQNKLGVVVFQFHLGFGPSEENKRHVVSCRKALHSDYPMVVEFRNHSWLDEARLSSTLAWLKSEELGLVCADDLEHELYGKACPAKPSDVVHVPVVCELGATFCCYVRVHRRVGNRRLLSDDEMRSWVSRINSERIQATIKGPVYFLWGTDHEDQPIINANSLAKHLGARAFDWKGSQPSTLLQGFLSAHGKQMKSIDRKAATGAKSPSKTDSSRSSTEISETSEGHSAISNLVETVSETAVEHLVVQFQKEHRKTGEVLKCSSLGSEKATNNTRGSVWDKTAPTFSHGSSTSSEMLMTDEGRLELSAKDDQSYLHSSAGLELSLSAVSSGGTVDRGSFLSDGVSAVQTRLESVSSSTDGVSSLRQSSPMSGERHEPHDLSSRLTAKKSGSDRQSPVGNHGTHPPLLLPTKRALSDISPAVNISTTPRKQKPSQRTICSFFQKVEKSPTQG